MNKSIKVTNVSYKGHRSNNEDELYINTENNPNIFSIYDGHGGSEVSEFLKKNIPSHFKNKTQNYK